MPSNVTTSTPGDTIKSAVGAMQTWLRGPGRIEHVLAIRHDLDGSRLEALRSSLPAETWDALRRTHVQAIPDADAERAFIGDMLAQLTSRDTRAAFPYIARALRSFEQARLAEDETDSQTFAALVGEALDCIGWALEAQDLAAGLLAPEDFAQSKLLDQLYGTFLHEINGSRTGQARHPAILGAREHADAFKWHRWAKGICEREYLPRAAKQLAPLLAMFADPGGYCFPTQERLVELSGMSRNGVKAALRDLERDLAINREVAQSGHRATGYRLLGWELKPFELAQARYAAEDAEDRPNA